MTKIAAKAARAKGLRANKAFQEFHGEVLAEQMAVFGNPASNADEIAESHAIIRALRKITDRMASAEFDHKIETKRAEKGQHRASD